MPITPLSIPHVEYAITNVAEGAIDFANTHFVPLRAASSHDARAMRTALEHLSARYGLGRDRVASFAGATGALAALALAVDGRIALEAVGFELMRLIPRRLGRETCSFDREDSPEAIAARLPLDTDQLWWTSPHNPSGHVASPDFLRALARELAPRGATLVVNEIYLDYVAGPPDSAVHLHENVAVVSSLTKVYGRGDLRFGWVAGPTALVAAAASTRFVTTGPAPTASVLEAADVLASSGGLRELAQRECTDRRRALVESATRVLGAGCASSERTPYMLLRLPTGVDDRAFADRARLEFGVRVAPGRFIDAPGHIRVSVSAAGPDFEEGLSRLVAAFEAIT